MCGRVSAQMRKLNQPIGAIQRSTKLMEPADCQRLKPQFLFYRLIWKWTDLAWEKCSEQFVGFVGGKGRGGEMEMIWRRWLGAAQFVGLSVSQDCLAPLPRLPAHQHLWPQHDPEPQKSPNTFDMGTLYWILDSRSFYVMVLSCVMVLACITVLAVS